MAEAIKKQGGNPLQQNLKFEDLPVTERFAISVMVVFKGLSILTGVAIVVALTAMSILMSAALGFWHADTAIPFSVDAVFPTACIVLAIALVYLSAKWHGGIEGVIFSKVVAVWCLLLIVLDLIAAATFVAAMDQKAKTAGDGGKLARLEASFNRAEATVDLAFNRMDETELHKAKRTKEYNQALAESNRASSELDEYKSDNPTESLAIFALLSRVLNIPFDTLLLSMRLLLVVSVVLTNFVVLKAVMQDINKMPLPSPKPKRKKSVKNTEGNRDKKTTPKKVPDITPEQPDLYVVKNSGVKKKRVKKTAYKKKRKPVEGRYQDVKTGVILGEIEPTNEAIKLSGVGSDYATKFHQRLVDESVLIKNENSKGYRVCESYREDFIKANPELQVA